jgi:hypothetical protein
MNLNGPTYPKQAEEITGITVRTQWTWRERGFLRSGEGGWSKFSNRDLCELLLLREFSERGVPLLQAASFIPDQMLDTMEGALADALNGFDSGDRLGIYAVWPNGVTRTCVALSWDQARQQLTSEDDQGRRFLGFRSRVEVNFAQLAREMACRMKLAASKEPK